MVPLDFSTPRLLRGEAEYERAAAKIDALVDRDPAPYTVIALSDLLGISLDGLLR